VVFQTPLELKPNGNEKYLYNQAVCFLLPKSKKKSQKEKKRKTWASRGTKGMFLAPLPRLLK